MKMPTLVSTGPVALTAIDVRDRLRPVSESGVESIMASINEVGVMKDPVHLRRKKDGKLVLIAGGHRIEAAKRLGWEEVEARIWTDVTDDWARMMEIDDNLAGAELTPLDHAIFLAQRKVVYERLHPEATRGGDRRSQHFQTDIESVRSFVAVTADKFGIDERHVRRLVAAGSKINHPDATLLRSAPRPVTLKDLIDLSREGNAAARYEAVQAFASGGAKKIGEALKARAAREAGIKPPVKDKVDDAFMALKKLWVRAPKAAKRRFVDEFGSDIAQIIGEGGDA